MSIRFWPEIGHFLLSRKILDEYDLSTTIREIASHVNIQDIDEKHPYPRSGSVSKFLLRPEQHILNKYWLSQIYRNEMNSTSRRNSTSQSTDAGLFKLDNPQNSGSWIYINKTNSTIRKLDNSISKWALLKNKALPEAGTPMNRLHYLLCLKNSEEFS